MSNKETAPQGHISIRAAANKYQASPDTIKKWAKSNVIPSLQPGGERGTKYVEIEALEKQLKERGVQSIYKDQTDEIQAADYTREVESPASTPQSSDETIQSDTPPPFHAPIVDTSTPSSPPVGGTRKRPKAGKLSDEQIDRIVMKRTARQLLLLRDKLTDALTRENASDAT